MKQFFLLALLTTPLAVTAQNLQPGTIALGGSISYYGYSESRTGTSSVATATNYYTYSGTQRQFGVGPTLSYFVANNLAVGLSAGYSTSYLRQEVTNSISPSSGSNIRTQTPWQTYSVGVFGQYYKMLSSQFGLTGQLGASYLHNTSHSESNDEANGYTQTNQSKGNGYYFNLTPGLVFFPTNRLGITLTGGALSFNHLWSTSASVAFDANANASTDNSESTTNSFLARFGFDQLYLGGAYYFGR